LKLDIGCGLQKLPGYLGIDINREESHADVLCSVECLPFQSNVFEMVYSRRCLQHVKSLSEALVEVNRVLVPSGCFWLVVSSWVGVVFFYLCRWRYHGKYSFCHLFSVGGLRRLFGSEVWVVLKVWKEKVRGSRSRELNLVAKKVVGVVRV
jgi:SAM-dependent methyltransferase